ncbi:MAG: hypothetical protein JJLCMIEE_02460 [Acidimicrobiales bacterium]|nr:MAG: flavodoxin [Actinomycetota bacterium]MBV6509391.1 hypothetical protein [Acidimicrobiales bacterium]RIK04578.1 MAG: flavodoxin [Acidobacteriota bacterium]
MRVLVVYESVYGNTHTIADAVAEGFRSPGTEIEVLAVDDASRELVQAADMVVVGGPTHAHGMSWATTRQTAVGDEKKKAEEADPDQPAHELDESATGEGLRHWFHDIGKVERTGAAAFDTRFDRSPALTGSAARGIARRLRHHGFDLLDEPTSFFVEDTEGPLADHEVLRAREWGEALSARLASEAPAG